MFEVFTTKHEEQRVGVFVDVQNLYYSARNIYNARVNYSALLKETVGSRKLIRAIAYVIRAQMPEARLQLAYWRHMRVKQFEDRFDKI